MIFGSKNKPSDVWFDAFAFFPVKLTEGNSAGRYVWLETYEKRFNNTELGSWSTRRKGNVE